MSPRITHQSLVVMALAIIGALPVPAQTPLTPNSSQNPLNPQPPQVPSPPSKQGQEQDPFTQTYLTGNWGGERDVLDKKGVDFSAQYTAEVFGNPYGGNYGHGAVYDGLLNAGLSIDLEKLTGWWKGASFHANGFWMAGQSGTQKYVGDFSVFSNIDAYDTVRMDELWLQQNFLGDRVSLKFGQLSPYIDPYS
jgi:porin